MLLLACPSGFRKPGSSQLVVSGTIYVGGFERRGDPLEGAEVAIRRAGTGEVLASNVTSSTGGYRLSTTIEPGSHVLLVAGAPGHAPHVRALEAAPYTELTLSFSLEPLDELECTDQSCSAPASDLGWSTPPPMASGQAQAFDLANEPPLLVDVGAARPEVLALAYVLLDGGPAEDGGVPGDFGALRLRVPYAAWKSLVDAVPDSGLVEVPLWRFDVDAGAWQPLDAGVLVSEGGLELPESALGALQRGELAGGAIATAPFVGSGFVAVTGAPQPLGCIEGQLVAEGEKAKGASVFVARSEAASVGVDGRFCAAAPTGSEPVLARAQYAGLLYTMDALPRPASASTCGSGCAQAGTLTLKGDGLVAAKSCTFTGRVVDTQGQPVPEAQVVAFDDSVAGNTFNAFCGRLGTRCAIAAASDADGGFSLTAPILTSLYVGASANLQSARREGAVRVAGCPADGLVLKLVRGRELVDVTVSYSGSSIAWTPPRAAARITVQDAMGAPLWEIASPGGMLPPVTFGQLPAGALEVTAASGTPAAGDVATVELEGTGRDGVQYGGSGSATRP